MLPIEAYKIRLECEDTERGYPFKWFLIVKETGVVAEFSVGTYYTPDLAYSNALAFLMKLEAPSKEDDEMLRRWALTDEIRDALEGDLL